MSAIIRPANFDFKKPDYTVIFSARAEALARIRAEPDCLPDLHLHYKLNPAQFIMDWGVTQDPRNADINLPTIVPFILFDKQIEFMDLVLESWRARKPLIVEKSRDMGISWCAMALSCALCLYGDVAIGFGSRKEEYVDKIGDPKSLFYKARIFLRYLPAEFRGGWDIDKHGPHMRIMFPKTGAIIAGEAGDGIGRGDRKAIYFVDEAAHLERPELVDASLSSTTNCRIDMSSVVGMANPFAAKRHSGKHRVFTFHWRDDPRKDEEWYEKKKLELDPKVVAQEIDINYTASVDGVVIESHWIQAAIDAHIKLKILPTGKRRLALDVADAGRDKNALADRHGIVLLNVESWSGAQKAGNNRQWDIVDTTEKCFSICDERGISSFEYDADGLGASVRGDARKINERRKDENRGRKPGEPLLKQIGVLPFRGSASGESLYQPEAFVRTPSGELLDRKNKDYYANYKAQGWWSLRYRFQNTYAAIHGAPFDPDALISISSGFAERAALIMELSQPVYLINGAGKILIDKVPDGVASPNLADAVMIAYAPRRMALEISDTVLGVV